MKRLFFILGFLFIFAFPNVSLGAVNIAVISDSIYTKENPYNWYFKTPDFLIQDISDILREDRNINVVPYSKVKAILTKNGVEL